MFTRSSLTDAAGVTFVVTHEAERHVLRVSPRLLPGCYQLLPDADVALESTAALRHSLATRRRHWPLLIGRKALSVFGTASYGVNNKKQFKRKDRG